MQHLERRQDNLLMTGCPETLRDNAVSRQTLVITGGTSHMEVLPLSTEYGHGILERKWTVSNYKQITAIWQQPVNTSQSFGNSSEEVMSTDH